MGHGLIGYLYPRTCCHCNVFVADSVLFCAACAASIQPLARHTIMVGPMAVPVFSLSSYTPPLKSLVLRKSRSCDTSFMYLAQLLYERTSLQDTQFDIVVPVPLHWTRRVRRGFNQAHVMAKTLGGLLHVPVINILRRSKKTFYQKSLALGRRPDNVRHAFSVRWEYADVLYELLENKSVLVVDDLWTTGSTIKGVLQVLAMANPRHMAAAVACRVI